MESDELDALFPYQETGAAYLAHHAQALLADDMGLGKSAQFIRACDLVGARSVLVLCPAIVRINWAREFWRFSPFDRHVSIIESGKDTFTHVGITVCSYDLIASNERLRERLKAVRWDVLGLDEAHYLKERSARRTKAVYGFRGRPGLAATARFVWRLTGTPAPNNASELYTHLSSAGIIREPFWDFTFRYCSGFNSDYGYKITGSRNTEDLKKLLARFMLRRKKDDIMKDLPPITFSDFMVERSDVELDPLFFEQYQSIGQDAFLAKLKADDSALRHALNAIREKHANGTHITGQQDAVSVLEGMAGSLNSLRRYLALAKMPKVCDIIEEELATGAIEKIVIFAIHKDVVEGCRQRFRKFGGVTLYGGTPADTRQRNIDSFQNDPKCRVIICNIIAAGTGITLTAAHHVAFVEADWSPANNAQAVMRCHRIGQTKHVRVRFFICANSVDVEVVNVLKRKTREIAKFVP